jgi:TRAP-type C4-dicarboxylate transport system permease small subunit
MDGHNTEYRTSIVAESPIRLSLILSEVAILAMVVMVTLDVILRNAINSPLLFTGEYSGYLLVLIGFLGLPYSLRNGSLLRIELLIASIPFQASRWLTIVYNAIALVLAAIFFWQYLDLVLTSLKRNVLAPTLMGTPLWLPQLVMPIGTAVLMWALCLEIRDAWHGKIHPLGENSEDGTLGGGI